MKLMNNVNSTTGSNLKEISLLVNKRVDDLSPRDASEILYHPVSNQEEFRVSFIWELLNVKDDQLEVVGFSEDELGMILEHLCTS